CLRHRYMQRCRIRYDIHSPRAAAHLEWLHISNARRISSIPPGMDIDQFEKLQFVCLPGWNAERTGRGQKEQNA
ncbi:MAG: hypothetical protein MR426_06855, partial [Clostridiales bacterium]|nr:hypothetical protein [Clostridiales bacterium]